MIIGIPKEIKEQEYRVSMIPANVERLVKSGHQVYVEKNAGKAAGFSDVQYEKAGANILETEKEIFEQCELVIKVKEILPCEFNYLKSNQILFTYIHSANRRPQTDAILNSKMVAFAYEDVKDDGGRFPLLEPMSKLAGEVGALTGIFYSFASNGGSGKSVCGTPGVAPMKVVIFGAGNVGLAAAKLTAGMNANVVLMDTNVRRLDDILQNTPPNISTVYSNEYNVRREIRNADIVINAVKWFPGLRILTREMLSEMEPNSMIVDIDAEPDGAIETCRYSTHSEPVYYVDGIRHICIPNLPSSVANTASCALSNATIPYILQIANKGWKKAAIENNSLRQGLDFIKGTLTFKDTAEAFDMEYKDPLDVINQL